MEDRMLWILPTSQLHNVVNNVLDGTANRFSGFSLNVVKRFMIEDVEYVVYYVDFTHTQEYLDKVAYLKKLESELK